MHRRGKTVVPTQLAWHLRDTHDGLLVAAVVALHENSKVKLEEAELFFQVQQTARSSLKSHCAGMGYMIVELSDLYIF